MDPPADLRCIRDIDGLVDPGYEVRGQPLMEILGWSSMAVLRRYLGRIPVAQLKRYPTTLDRVFGRAV
ncbi:MAG: hypothetical protein ACRDM0_00415 [Thermoleophilaceae bacterium]